MFESAHREQKTLKKKKKKREGAKKAEKQQFSPHPLFPPRWSLAPGGPFGGLARQHGTNRPRHGRTKEAGWRVAETCNAMYG